MQAHAGGQLGLPADGNTNNLLHYIMLAVIRDTGFPDRLLFGICS